MKMYLKKTQTPAKKLNYAVVKKSTSSTVKIFLGLRKSEN